MIRLRGFVVAAVLGVGAFVVRAGDWPQWRGVDRTGRVGAGVAVPEGLPAAPRVVWHLPVGNGLASPVVAGGRVFYLDNRENKETLYAAEAGTGKAIWRATVDEVFKDTQSPAGPRCTPVVDGDRVYAQSCRGQLICFGVADGKEIWRANYVKDFGAVFIGEKGQAQGATRHGYNAPPIVDGEHLIAEVGGKEGAAFVCFEKRTGKVVWKAGTVTPAYAAPVIATVAGVRQVIAFVVEGVVGIDPADGRELWRVPVKTALGRHVTTPVVYEDMVCVSSHQAGLIGIRVTKEGAGLAARAEWTKKELAVNFSCPVNVGGYLFGVGPRRNLICVEIRTGKEMWSKEGVLMGNASNAHAGMIVMGDRVMVLTDGGALVMIAADHGGYREVGRAQVCGKNWCNPAYADGNVALRDDREVWCVRVMP
jgi:outer membrane protein assembly factor BamB